MRSWGASADLQTWQVSHMIGCLGLALQVLDKLPPIDLTYHMQIPMMLAYGPESYAYQTWCEDRGVTSALSGEARASCLLMWQLKWLAHGRGIDDSSSDRSASPAHSACSAAPHSPRRSSSKSHSRSKSFSLQCWQSGSQLSFTASIYSQVTQKELVQASGSESSSEADMEYQASGNSDHKAGEDSDSKGEGSGGSGEGLGHEGEGSGGKGRPGDGSSQQGDSSGKMVEVSYHEAEESGSESSSSFLNLRWKQRRPVPARKPWRLTPTPLYLNLIAKTLRRSIR